VVNHFIISTYFDTKNIKHPIGAKVFLHRMAAVLILNFLDIISVKYKGLAFMNTSYYQFLFIISSIIIMLYYMEAYSAILVVVLFIAFSLIVLKNTKYEYMVHYIRRFF